ncbi:hypothetical protein BpHYR1_007152 [Brachionus plicatilis]|uniref:Uncharacterized protein n=1 Tax=Brachionus plicatilis TaxID=10195 RepID=A0A3M7PW87_BRAPC|nr:hypothetical protein BpHYR1_007152 [Brachionus plicatilis]
MAYKVDNRCFNCGGTCSKNCLQFSSPTWFLKPLITLLNISFKSGFGLFHEAMASQKNTKSLTTPAGFNVIMWHMPLKAESFSSLSLIDLNEEHHTRIKDCKKGATCCGQTRPNLPIVMAVFSSNVFGVLGLFIISMRGSKNKPIY